MNLGSTFNHKKVKLCKHKLKQYMKGDERAIGVLINRHNARLTGFIYSKVGDRELTEDIFGVSINTALGRMRYALINLRKLVEANSIVLTN